MIIPAVPFTKRVYPYNLRWILFGTSLVGIIWAIAMGVQQFQNRESDARPSKLQVFDIVTGILYMVVALLEFYVFLVASLHNAKLGKLLKVVAPVGVAVAVGTQILVIIIHFALKKDKIDQCVSNYTTIPSIFIDGKLSTATQEQASQWCDDAFSRGSWTYVAWLVMVILVSLFFASMTLQYARQLADPSLVRTRQQLNQQNQQAYPLQPSNPGFYPPPPLQHQDSNSWIAPPYSGPTDSNTPLPPTYDKGAYHPSAGWANTPDEHLDEDPFRSSPGQGGSHDAEERAWREARDGGVTAHLTGQGSRVREDDDTRGFVVSNKPEDEAWERAKREGVTAHLTGGGVGKGEARV